MYNTIYLVVEFKVIDCENIYDERSHADLTFSKSNALKLYQKYREDLVEHKADCKQYILMLASYDFDTFADRLEDFIEASGNQKTLSDTFFRFGKENTEDEKRKFTVVKAVRVSDSGDIIE